jgi:hypothetical protein
MPLIIRSATDKDEAEVIALWRNCDLVTSYNNSAADFKFAKRGAIVDRADLGRMSRPDAGAFPPENPGGQFA